MQEFSIFPEVPSDFTGQCKINYSNSICYYLNGKPHRLDGPAITLGNGDKHWYNQGKLTRLDGPAIEYANGYKVWYVDDWHYSREEFYKLPEVRAFRRAKIKQLLLSMPSSFKLFFNRIIRRRSP